MTGFLSVVFLLLLLADSSDLRAAGISERVTEWNNLRDISAQLFDSKDFDKSEANLRTALQIARDSSNDTATLTSLRELGVVCEWAGKFAEAERLFTEALEIQSRLKGHDNPELVVTLNYLGVAQRELQHYRASIDSHERALRIVASQAAHDKTLLATTHYGLAVAHDVGGKAADAEEHYREALRAWDGASGFDKATKIRTLIRVGRLYAERGNFHDAEQSMKRVVKLLPPVVKGPEWLEYLDTRATISLYQGKYTNAQQHWEQAQALGESLFGPDDPNVVTLQVRRGELHILLREYADAKKLLEECLRLRSTEAQGDNPDVALVLTHLALVATRTRDFVQAASYFERAHRILKKNPSAHPLYLAVTSGCQGEFYGVQGMWTEAAASFETALRLKRQTLGNAHPALVDTLASYAHALSKIRRKKEARQYQEQARDIASGYAEAAAFKSATVDIRALRAER